MGGRREKQCTNSKDKYIIYMDILQKNPHYNKQKAFELTLQVCAS